jgi:type IV fimbrial biogenesis protein FimT
MARHAGFSLIELVATLAVASTTLALAFPGARDGIERHRVATSLHLLSADMAMARSQAVLRRQPVVLCPGTPASGCLGADDWHHGWMVFADADGDREPTTGDVLRATDAPGARNLRYTSTRPLLRYQPSGTSAHSNLTVSTCVRGMLRGSVVVNRLGRVRAERPSAPRPCPGGY